MIRFINAQKGLLVIIQTGIAMSEDTKEIQSPLVIFFSPTKYADIAINKQVNAINAKIHEDGPPSSLNCA